LVLRPDAPRRCRCLFAQLRRCGRSRGCVHPGHGAPKGWNRAL